MSQSFQSLHWPTRKDQLFRPVIKNLLVIHYKTLEKTEFIIFFSFAGVTNPFEML